MPSTRMSTRSTSKLSTQQTSSLSTQNIHLRTLFTSPLPQAGMPAHPLSNMLCLEPPCAWLSSTIPAPRPTTPTPPIHHEIPTSFIRASACEKTHMSGPSRTPSQLRMASLLAAYNVSSPSPAEAESINAVDPFPSAIGPVWVLGETETQRKEARKPAKKRKKGGKDGGCASGSIATGKRDVEVLERKEGGKENEGCGLGLREEGDGFQTECKGLGDLEVGRERVRVVREGAKNVERLGRRGAAEVLATEEGENNKKGRERRERRETGMDVVKESGGLRKRKRKPVRR